MSRYDFLAPSPDSLPEKYRHQDDAEDGELLMKENGVGDQSQSQPLPETEPLWHMAQSKQHRSVNKHIFSFCQSLM